MKVLPRVLSQLMDSRNSDRFSVYQEADIPDSYDSRLSTGWFWSTSISDNHLWNADSDSLPFVSKEEAVAYARARGFSDSVWVVRGRKFAREEVTWKTTGILDADHIVQQDCVVSNFELCGDEPERVEL